MTKGQRLNHDFTKDSLKLYDTNGKLIYYESSTGYWFKQEYDSNSNQTYCEDSSGYWYKREYDTNGNETYFENSEGFVRHSIW